MILITGAAGFIGSALAWELNRRGRHDLILVDQLGKGDKWKNLLGIRNSRFIDRAELFDQLETSWWRDQVEVVYHIGANADTTLLDGNFLHQWNYNYSRRLAKWSLENGSRFIYASSAAVYGDGTLGFSDDPAQTIQLKPLNPYGFSKWLFDCFVLEHHWDEHLTGFRFFNVYGPNEYHKGRMASVILHAFPQAQQSGKIRLFESHREGYSHGEQTRDFISIWEVLDGLLYAYDHPELKGTYNLGTGTPHTFNQLAAAVFKALGKPTNIEYFPTPEDLRARYQYYTCADMSRMQAQGFPAFADNFEDHVGRYVRDYLVADKRLSE